MDPKNKNNSKVIMAGETYTEKSFELLNNIGEYIAEYSIGQFILKKFDDFLWIVEKIAQWSVPIKSLEKSEGNLPAIINDSNDKSAPNTLVRPLPWILFFPALIALRILKGVLNTIAMLLGLETITSITIVKFINGKRVKLNTIRTTGISNALLKKHGLDYRALIKRLYSNILSALCFQRVCMESNTNHRQNVEPMIVGSTNTEKSVTETEEHNHVKNDIVTDNNVDEIIKRIKDYAEQSSSFGEESDIDLSEPEDVNDDDGSASSTNVSDNEIIEENKKNSHVDNAPSDDSTYSTPKLESIAPSIKSQIIAEETEDSDVSTKGTVSNTKGAVNKFKTHTRVSLNKETSSKRDLESELNESVDNDIDVLDELIRNSIKTDIIENGEDQSSNSCADTIITNEFMNNEIHSENDSINSQNKSPKVDSCNNLEDDQLRLDMMVKKGNNHVTDNASTITGSTVS
ncbi:uncharacterized protein LOC123299157 isoform X2 [Chrysoperla carnea]|uniref:uncharacterized protein LOC123299157 isoform X2 n=1 Tax=Chrysoperla carnea TaxID=189513 RepID=UPI001D06AD96|nr:uncharacterized protein LOC123299157 isoform X2 [Chrysoperla carnea]